MRTRHARMHRVAPAATRAPASSPRPPDRRSLGLGEVGEARGMAPRDDEEVTEIRIAAVGQRRDVEGHREFVLPEHAARHRHVAG